MTILLLGKCTEVVLCWLFAAFVCIVSTQTSWNKILRTFVWKLSHTTCAYQKQSNLTFFNFNFKFPCKLHIYLGGLTRSDYWYSVHINLRTIDLKFNNLLQLQFIQSLKFSRPRVLSRSWQPVEFHWLWRRLQPPVLVIKLIHWINLITLGHLNSNISFVCKFNSLIQITWCTSFAHEQLIFHMLIKCF